MNLPKKGNSQPTRGFRNIKRVSLAIRGPKRAVGSRHLKEPLLHGEGEGWKGGNDSKKKKNRQLQRIVQNRDLQRFAESCTGKDQKKKGVKIIYPKRGRGGK